MVGCLGEEAAPLGSTDTTPPSSWSLKIGGEKGGMAKN